MQAALPPPPSCDDQQSPDMPSTLLPTTTALTTATPWGWVFTDSKAPAEAVLLPRSHGFIYISVLYVLVNVLPFLNPYKHFQVSLLTPSQHVTVGG